MIPPDLQRLVAEAEARYLDRTLDTVAASVGVGVRALQSRERTADLALRLRVAWTPPGGAARVEMVEVKGLPASL